MAKNLADRLEALSGYRYVFPPNDPNAHLNPVVYSHLRVTVGGKPYHVLSRICAAGLDYTQRSNKFAHHVVLDQKELTASGPAALLAAPDFMESTWQGEPRILASARKLPQIAVAPAVCCHWQQVAGDAGWAGVLAEAATQATPRMAAVIFRPGTDVLSLVSEALALLPTPLRWQVTFSTFFTKLPPEVQCQWRFVLAGSPEARALQRSARFVTIDLSKLPGVAPNSPMVTAARTGVPPKRTVEPKRKVAPVRQPTVAPIAQVLGIVEDIPPQSPSPDEWDPLSMMPPPVGGVSRRSETQGRQRRRRRNIALIVGGSIAAAILAIVGVYGAISLREARTELAVAADGDSSPGDKKARVADPPKEPAGKSGDDPSGAKDKVIADPKKQSKVGNAKEKHPAGKDAPTTDGKTTQVGAEARGASQQVKNKLAGFASRISGDPVGATVAAQTRSLLPGLPPYFDVIGVEKPTSFDKDRVAKIAELENVPIAECKFKLLGQKSALKRDWEFDLKRVGKTEPVEIEIRLKLPGRENFEGKPKPIAVLTAESNSLKFAWKNLQSSTTIERAHCLRNCVLQLSYGGAVGFVALRTPATDIDPIQISFDKKEVYEQLGLKQWPLTPVKLEVPEAFQRKAKMSGYSVEGAGDQEIDITPNNKKMPNFKLRLNAQRNRVELDIRWSLLGPPDGSQTKGRLAARLARAKSEVESAKETWDRKTQHETSLKRKPQKNKEAITRANTAVTRAKQKHVEAMDVRKVIQSVQNLYSAKQLVIPFVLVTYVESHRVVIARSKDSPSPSQ